jgi:hypothetical protein
MLLRRIIAHVRKQEWTAIAIDFVIVVVGVFIGIQVANLNDERVNRQRAQGYLERIHDDLGADLELYGDRMAFWANVSEYGRAGLTYAETGRAGDLSQWQLLLAYFQASQVAEFSTVDSTYSELTSAGELDLIADLELRRSLALYYATAANPILSERPAYREHIRGIIPIAIQDHIWANCYQSSARGVQEMRDCDAPISNAEAAALVARISRDATLMSELRYWVSTMRVAAVIGDNRTDYANELRATVGADLGLETQ